MRQDKIKTGAPTTIIFYAKSMPHPGTPEVPNWWYRELHYGLQKTLPLKKSFFRNNWRQVGTSNSKDPEELFVMYNRDYTNPLATSQGQQLIRSLGVRHTSMSVGDIVKVRNFYYIAAGEGFKRVVWK